MHREAARARMRAWVKRLLRKYGYPPDLQDATVQKVLQQAEATPAGAVQSNNSNNFTLANQRRRSQSVGTG